MTGRMVLIIKIVSFFTIIEIVPVRYSLFLRNFLRQNTTVEEFLIGEIRW
jgi:hypothetical protein